MKYRIAYQLFDSAHAFFESAVTLAKERGKQESKSAALHLGIAIEVLAKARLASEDLQLLVRGARPLDEAALLRGDFHSIGMEEAFVELDRRRLHRPTPRQSKVLGSLRDLRNRLVHFVASAPQEEVQAIVLSAANLFLELHSTLFAGWEPPYGVRNIVEVSADLADIEAFVAERIEALRERIETSARPRTHYFDECSRCLQDATTIEGEEFVCLFCSERRTIESFTRMISEDKSVSQCTECRRMSVAMQKVDPEQPTHECVCCGHCEGPEPRWAEFRGPSIPRLHNRPDRPPTETGATRTTV